ncbi:gp53-like domain-containing protein [Enterobacter asburiae]|uniref:gp53-like domain-containing protein n=1 Tax=Enterobacter asburiae TaxID=61645 RepID=UPI003D6E9A06
MRPLMPPVQTPDNLFHDGNPLTGELGTIVDADHLNNEQAAIRDTQSELIAILTAAAMEPESTAGQLLAALNKLYAPLNDTLGALSSLVGGANKLPYFTSANAAALTALSSIGRDIVGKATVADVLTYLGLGTAATKNVGVGAGQIPDMSSFTNASGWQKLPGGKILQWGKAGFPVGQTQISVPFPINFPSVVSNIQLTFADINFSGGTPSPTLAVVNNTVNGAGFGAYMSGAGGFNAYFFAIGS